MHRGSFSLLVCAGQTLAAHCLFPSSVLANAWKLYLLKLAQLRPLATLSVISETRMKNPLISRLKEMYRLAIENAMSCGTTWQAEKGIPSEQCAACLLHVPSGI